MLKDKANLSKKIVKIFENQDEMIQLELKLIKENINNPLCVNMIIGDPTFGGVVQHSTESKKKISEGITKYFAENLAKATNHMSNIGKMQIGKPKSQSHKESMSKARTGIPKTEEHKKLLSLSNKGKTLRPRETLCKTWKITDTKTGSIFIIYDRVEFCKNNGFNYQSFNVSTRDGRLFKKQWLCKKLL